MQSTMTYPTKNLFITKTRALLAQEEQFEIAQFAEMVNKPLNDLQNQGQALSNMIITNSKQGFYGKAILTLTKTYHSEKNPILIPEDCKIQVGDDVTLYRNNSIIAEGVVYKRQGHKIKITIRQELDDDNDLEGTNCHILLKWNQVTFRRYNHALNDLEKSDSPLLSIFFTPHVCPPSKIRPIEYENPNLNEQQKQAVSCCLAQPVHLIHGPPGTGKTTTVCNLIVEAVKRGQKVLACGPSNISVDNMVEDLHLRVNCVRIGNPARVIQTIIEHTLDSRISQHSSLWKNELKKLLAIRKKLSKTNQRDQRKSLQQEIKHLRQQIYNLQQQTIEEILNDTDVICCTNVGAADRVFRKYLPKRIFDLVVIDQCGQSLEVSCWIPILKGRRVVLAGDHKQLPPTIKTNNEALSLTLFSRAMTQLQLPSTMLKVQYRMHNSIMGWSNQQFYEHQLSAHESVKDHQLQHLYQAVQGDTIMMVDTAGCGMGQQGEQNESKFNVGQADIALSLLRKLTEYGVEAKHIAILTPYSKQVAYIKSLLQEQQIIPPDVSTVDGIQGRQKQCIIISLVRSNSSQSLGFLKDWRRINVAVTRARRMLIVIGNSECISADSHLKTLVQWIQKNGHLCSAHEFKNDDRVRFGLGASDKIEEYNKQVDKIKKKKKNTNQSQNVQHQNLNKKEHTEAQQQQLKNYYRNIFSTMDRQLTLNNVSAYARKMIHQVAEEMKLAHQTSEDKSYIKIWRLLTNEELKTKLEQMQRQQKEQEDISQTKNKKKKKKLQQQNRQKQVNRNKNNNKLTTQDMKDLIGDQSSDQQKQQKPKEEQLVKQQQKIEEKPIKSKKKKQKKQRQPEPEEDIEAIMAEFKANQPKQDECFKCKKKISSVTASQCKYCRINYCRFHVLAEEHGCDQQAKIDARKMKSSEAFLQLAAQKIKQKIKQQEQSRKRKPKQANTKKR